MSKRIFDVVLALLTLVLLLPITLAVAVMIRWKLGAPIFFTQQRTGKDGLRFRMIKFRTMTNETDETGNLLPNAQRMTPFGNMLRSTSLDELPEILNVLMGQMSFVGPRPLLPEYDELYSEKHARRLSVRPGITGWAQVNGRSTLDWGSRFDQDIWYIENQSMFLDLRVLALTVKKVLFRDGVTTPDQNERFKGYDE